MEELKKDLSPFLENEKFAIVDGPMYNPEPLVRISRKGIMWGLHFDEYSNFLLQLQGRKRVILLPYSESCYLSLGERGTKAYRHSNIDFSSFLTNRETKQSLLELFPNLQHARATQVILEPGEALYIPPYVLHWTEALDDSVTVNRFSGYPKPPPHYEVNCVDFSKKKGTNRNIVPLEESISQEMIDSVASLLKTGSDIASSLHRRNGKEKNGLVTHASSFSPRTGQERENVAATLAMQLSSLLNESSDQISLIKEAARQTLPEKQSKEIVNAVEALKMGSVSLEEERALLTDLVQRSSKRSKRFDKSNIAILQEIVTEIRRLEANPSFTNLRTSLIDRLLITLQPKMSFSNFGWGSLYYQGFYRILRKSRTAISTIHKMKKKDLKFIVFGANIGVEVFFAALSPLTESLHVKGFEIVCPFIEIAKSIQTKYSVLAEPHVELKCDNVLSIQPEEFNKFGLIWSDDAGWDDTVVHENCKRIAQYLPKDSILLTFRGKECKKYLSQINREDGLSLVQVERMMVNASWGVEGKVPIFIHRMQ
eukprot:g3187.t1